MQRDHGRRASTMGLVAGLAALCLAWGERAAAAPDAAGESAGPDPAAVAVLEDAITAIEEFDGDLYDDAVARVESGDVWLPDAVTETLLDRDIESLDFWLEVVGDDDIELYSWAKVMVDDEQRLVGEVANGRATPAERAWADEDGNVVLQLLLQRGLPVPPRVRAALSLLEPGAPPPAGSVYDSASQLLWDIYLSDDPYLAADGQWIPMPPPAEDAAAAPAAPAGETPAEDAAAAPAAPAGETPAVEAPAVDPVNVPPAANSGSSSGSSSNLLVGLALGVALISMLIGVGAVLRGRRHDRLADIAYTDSLTGLRNRRRMDADVAEQTELSARPTATLMIDVDHFKQFNDTYGHAVGDEVLRLVGAALARHFRKTDVPYRYGGEEFCVLLPETTEAEAMLAGERIRAAVEAIELPVDEHITVSIGVSIGPASQISDTLERADGALYTAKQNGRNRVSLA